jgi:fructokinase
MRSLLEHADVVKVSDEELRFLTGGDDEDAARSLWHDGWQLLLVTRGETGVDYLLPDHAGSVPGYRVEVHDTTGAGDAFTAAVLAAIVETQGTLDDPALLERALRRANAFAALTVTRPGAIPGMPTRARLEAFMKERGVR